MPIWIESIGRSRSRRSRGDIRQIDVIYAEVFAFIEMTIYPSRCASRKSWMIIDYSQAVQITITYLLCLEYREVFSVITFTDWMFQRFDVIATDSPFLTSILHVFECVRICSFGYAIRYCSSLLRYPVSVLKLAAACLQSLHGAVP